MSVQGNHRTLRRFLAARSTSASPHDAGVERGPRRGASKVPPLHGMRVSALVGMARRTVCARIVAGGTNIQPAAAIERVAPLHAARTSQRDVRAMSLPRLTSTLTVGEGPGNRSAVCKNDSDHS